MLTRGSSPVIVVNWATWPYGGDAGGRLVVIGDGGHKVVAVSGGGRVVCVVDTSLLLVMTVVTVWSSSGSWLW
jgi:hypothetical protein